MATMQIGALVVDLIAESAQYIQGLQQANQATNRWSRNTTRSFDSVAKNIAGLAAGYLSISAAVGAANRAMADAKEIENLARIAGQSVEEFQAATYAVDGLGVSAEKLADISQETIRKLGEYTAVGTGGFVDFFNDVAPKVGLTAEALKGLSGTEVLIAVKKAMDDANVSMEQQRWLLDAIASDADALIPILENNGKAYRQLGQDANDANLVMSQADITALKESEQVLSRLGSQMSTGFARLVAGSAEQLNWLGQVTSAVMTQIGNEFDALNDRPNTVGGTIEKIADLQEDIDETEKKIKLLREDEGAQNQEWWIDHWAKKLDEMNKEMEGLLEHRQNLQFPEQPETKNPFEKVKGDAEKAVKGLTEANQKIIDSLNNRLETEQKQLKIHHDKQVELIKSLTLTKNELAATQFESNEELRKYYLDLEDKDYKKQKAEAEQRVKDAAQAELDKHQSALESLQGQLLSEQELLKVHYDKQVEAINKQVLTETQLKKMGFDDIEAFRKDYLEKAKDDYDEQSEAIKQKQADEIQAEKDKHQQTLDSLLNSLDLQEKAINRRYDKQIETIKNLELEKAQIEALGYESRAELQKEWLKKNEEQREQALKDMRDETESSFTGMAEFFGTTTDTMDNAAKGWTRSFSNELANMVTKGEMDFARLAESIINDLIRITIQAKITQPMLEAMGLAKPVNTGTGTTTTPQKATGGSVMRGSTYLVGEQGPELFTASNSGSIIPNDRLGGGNTTVNVYTQPGETAETRTRTTPEGDVVEIFMKQVDSRLNEQVSRGQGLARTLESRYALNRKPF